jgi:uncharacterized protein (DUF1330 family)
MSEMQATLVVTATPNPNAMEEMQTYLTRVIPILKNHGGQIVFRGKTIKPIEGSINFGMLLVIHFESVEIIERIFETSEYTELIPFRDKGFKKMDMVISSAL